MQNKIIQSIHHEHAENIFIGAKGYEMRKTAPKGGNFPYIIYLYETQHLYKGAGGVLFPGAGAVVGFYTCNAIIKTNAFGAALHKSNTPEEAAARAEIAKRASFIVREHSYDRETHTRTITKIKKLFDVSAVDFPAYNETSITTARGFFSEEHEKEFKALEERARRQKLIALTYC